MSAQVPAVPTFRISVDLVQVDAVVTDAKGNPVRNLEAADFRILEDGKPQTITSFSRVDGEPIVAGAAPAAPSVAPRKEEVARSIVLMFDDSGFHAEEDLTPVIPEAHRFIDEQLGPHDLAAVTTSRGGMGFYQQFTNDKRQLHAALDRVTHRRGYGMLTLDVPLVLNPDTGKLEPAFVLKAGEPGLGYRDPKHPPNPLARLVWAIQGLQHVPGRKAVVLFTHSFAAPPFLIDLANRAGVVIHVIDPHGFEGVVPSSAPYRQLAKQTGGLFRISSPGKSIVNDLRRALDESGSYYLLGYRPQHPETRHTIQVTVLRPGLEVRARNGYLGVPESEVKPAPTTPAERLVAALASPFTPGKIRLRIDPWYSASAPDPKTKRRKALLHVGLLLDGRDLALADGADGKQNLSYTALVIVAAQDGATAARGGRKFTLALSPDEVAKLRDSGVNPSLDIELPSPGEYQIRAAVRDETSGEIGSAYQFVEAPDFNRQRITLASIELPARAKDTPLLFRCGVFGFKTAAAGPKVDAQVILFRDGQPAPWLDTGPAPVPAASLAEHFVGGQLDLATLPPGEYTIQLLLWDRLAGAKSPPATQWARFTVPAK